MNLSLTQESNFLPFLLCLGAFSFLLLNLIISFSGFDFFTSDLSVYREWSYDIKSHREPQQLPGYPFLLFMSRELTLGILEDRFLMQFIVFISWVILVIFVNKILLDISPNISIFGTAFFGFYPFFGISFASYPLADIVAHACLAVSIYFLLQRRISFFIFSVIIGSFLHKAIWPTYLLLALYLLYKRDLKLRYAIMIAMPLTFYYLFLYLFLGFELQELGILRNLETNFYSNAEDYIFQGLIETLRHEFFTIKFFKGLCMIIVILTAIFLTITSALRKDFFYLSICIPVLGIGLFVNEFTSSGLLRHSKFLIFPLCYYCNQIVFFNKFLSSNLFIFIFLTILVLSQFFFVIFRLL